LKRIAIPIVVSFIFATSSFAQKNEINLGIGAVITGDQNAHLLLGVLCTITNPNCNTFTSSTSTAVAIEGTFARQLISLGPASIDLEIPLVGVPSRDVKLGNPGTPLPQLTRSVSSFFFTPAARVRFLHSSPISPFVSVGQGLQHLGTNVNSPGSDSNHWALQFGGGLDFKTPLPHLAVRAQIRDFWSHGQLEFANLTSVSPDYVHNIFAGGGVVFRF
jgi:hypothetical protein